MSRETLYTFPPASVNSVSATQTTTASNAAVILNGSLSNIGNLNGIGYIPQAFFAGIQRAISITSTGNISTSTFTISGYDTRATGLLATAIAGPNNATVNTVTEFQKITSVSVGTLASSTFTVGSWATGTGNPKFMDRWANPFSVTIAVITDTGNPVTIQDTPVEGVTTATQWFNHATLVGVTANQEGNYAYPVRYIRPIFTASATATGNANVYISQAG